MTQSPRLKITQGKMREIRRRASQTTVGMLARNRLNIIYPSKANNVLAVWDNFPTPLGLYAPEKKRGKKTMTTFPRRFLIIFELNSKWVSGAELS